MANACKKGMKILIEKGKEILLYEISSSIWQLGEYFLSGEHRIQSQPLIPDIKLSVAPNFIKGISHEGNFPPPKKKWKKYDVCH